MLAVGCRYREGQQISNRVVFQAIDISKGPKVSSGAISAALQQIYPNTNARFDDLNVDAWAFSMRSSPAAAEPSSSSPPNAALLLVAENHILMATQHYTGRTLNHIASHVFDDGPEEAPLHGSLSQSTVRKRLDEVAAMLMSSKGLEVEFRSAWTGKVSDFIGPSAAINKIYTANAAAAPRPATTPAAVVEAAPTEQADNHDEDTEDDFVKCLRNATCNLAHGHFGRCRANELVENAAAAAADTHPADDDDDNVNDGIDDNDDEDGVDDNRLEATKTQKQLSPSLLMGTFTNVTAAAATELYASRTTGRKRQPPQEIYVPTLPESNRDGSPERKGKAKKKAKTATGGGAATAAAAGSKAGAGTSISQMQVPICPVEVECGTARAMWDPRNPCSFLVLSVGEGVEMPSGPVVGSKLERLGGRGACKQWKNSVRVVLGNGETMTVARYCKYCLKIELPKIDKGSGGGTAPPPDPAAEKRKKAEVKKALLGVGFSKQEAECLLVENWSAKGRPDNSRSCDWTLRMPEGWSPTAARSIPDIKNAKKSGSSCQGGKSAGGYSSGKSGSRTGSGSGNHDKNKDKQQEKKM